MIKGSPSDPKNTAFISFMHLLGTGVASVVSGFLIVVVAFVMAVGLGFDPVDEISIKITDVILN